MMVWFELMQSYKHVGQNVFGKIYHKLIVKMANVWDRWRIYKIWTLQTLHSLHFFILPAR